jgi:hypothetical protein
MLAVKGEYVKSLLRIAYLVLAASFPIFKHFD